MTNERKEEWKLIIDRPDLYIYGAAKTAEKLYELIAHMGFQENIRGFLVTDSENNVPVLRGLPVYDIHYFEQKGVPVLVPHMGIYRRQISDLLDALNFKNVFFVSQLIVKIAQEECESIVPDNKKVGWEIYDQKTEIEKKQDTYIRERILSILQEGQPDFGAVKPYQSLELIGLEGIRPTEYRIREYGLRNILNSADDILDIGCNSGFIDLTIAGLVHSVTGIEYDESLIKAASLVKEYLNVTNCMFYNSDFNDWCRQAERKYQVIFSFAIHHWLNIEPGEYVAILDRLLNRYGYVCFESHVYETDVKFNGCCKEFEKSGYSVIFEKKINDDGLQERKYVLLQKMNA